MTWKTLPVSDATGLVAAQVAGQGRAVVLIHGVGLRAASMRPIGEHLTRGFCVHMVDMPGHGASPLAGAQALPGYIDRIGRYGMSLGQPFAVVGHSMGAMVALGIAERWPGQVTHVAALNAIYRRNPQAATAVQARAAALSDSAMSDPGPTLERWFGSPPEGALAEAARACRDMLTTVDPQGYKTAYRIFATQDGPSDDALRALSCPALFMTGADDVNSTPAMSQAMARLAPHGQASVIARSAHMLPMTHAEQVAKDLTTFLRPQGGGA